ncbi:26S proteasome non-ATPase regulatory subunit 4-like protein [Drosera capensis]
MAGKGVCVLVTPTSDLVKILACMHVNNLDHRQYYAPATIHRPKKKEESSHQPLAREHHRSSKLTFWSRPGSGGEINLMAGVQVAQLALKHRQNKKQQQRIIVFAGSPVKYDKKALEVVGRKFKKSSVAFDIVNFGENDDGKPEKLDALVSAANNNDSSHIVHVPVGPNALSDVLISTPIFTGDGEGGSGFAASAAAAAAGDPELALALRVSMEDERARREAAAKRAAEEAAMQEKGDEPQSSLQDATMTESTNTSNIKADLKTADLMDDENALLQQALAMSMSDSIPTANVRDTEMSDLPGVDPNDPSAKELLASMRNQCEKRDEDEASTEERKN